MLGKLALKLQRLADAEMQYERYKSGADVLANDLKSIRDGLEREVVKIIMDTTDKIEKDKVTGMAILSYIYSNSNKEVTNEKQS